MLSDMLKAKVYNQTGEDKGEVSLNPKVFEIPVKDELIHQAVVALLANRRQVLAHAKTRGEVRGGGRKPWKQKGTGRARHGSIRSPLWVGGGVTFGPTSDRNFSKKINKKMKTRALFMVLSEKALNKNVSVLEKLEIAEAKTKPIIELLKKIKLDKKVLLIIEKMDSKIARSVNNIPKITLISANSLNVYDVLNAKHLLVTKNALKTVEQTFLVK